MIAKYHEFSIIKWTFGTCPMTTKPFSSGLNSFSNTMKATFATGFQVYTIRRKRVDDVDFLFYYT